MIITQGECAIRARRGRCLNDVAQPPTSDAAIRSQPTGVVVSRLNPLEGGSWFGRTACAPSAALPARASLATAFEVAGFAIARRPCVRVVAHARAACVTPLTAIHAARRAARRASGSTASTMIRAARTSTARVG